MTSMDRRTFIARGAAAAGGAVAGSAALESLTNRMALADLRTDCRSSYGPPERMVDQLGRNVLALPAGFSYVTFGEIGSPMSDGAPTPLALDGMAAFRGPRGTVRLIRNHEDRNAAGRGSVAADPAAKYDPQAGGGTVTLDYDPCTRTLVRSFVSLAGTTVNCAGGIGLHGRSWLSGEETIVGPENSAFSQRHGYMFEVPVKRSLGDPPIGVPLKAMGRFSHEASATDQRTGVVYLTEDPGGGLGAGFYRFLPDDPRNLPAGGRLQILSIAGLPNHDAREGQEPGRSLPVAWIDIPEPDPPYANLRDPGGVFNQGRTLGAAVFNRLEGCWWADGSVFFVSTSGGDVKNGDVNADGFREGYGQVWEYREHHRKVGKRSALRVAGRRGADSPDTRRSRRAAVRACEDDASSVVDDPTPGLTNVNRLIGTARGEAFVFGVNTLSTSDSPRCFSPDGDTMFVNVYGSTGTPAQHAGVGMTCAITGRGGAGAVTVTPAGRQVCRGARLEMPDGGAGLLAERDLEVGEPARRWSSVCAIACDSRLTPARARSSGRSRSERIASRPPSSRQPAARKRSARRSRRPGAPARAPMGRPARPRHATAPTASRRAPAAARSAAAPAAAAARGRRGRRPAPAAAVEELAHLGAPQQREQRLRGGRLLRVPDHLDPQRGEPQRAPQHALDDLDRAHARDRHRRLAPRHQAAADPQAVAVAADGEAGERHHRAGDREQPCERPGARRRRAPTAGAVGEQADRLVARLLAEHVLGELPDTRRAPAGSRRSARR